jgi:hypothetical protein
VSPTAVVLLGVIAVAAVLMAAVQVGLVIAAIRLAKQVQDLRAWVEVEIRPLVANLVAASNQAVRVTEVAVEQVERADRLFADLARRVDEGSRLVQATLLAPLREGRALMAAVAAALGALRDARGAPAPPLAADDDPLFIG